MGGLYRKSNALMAALLVPAIVLSVFLFLNFLLWCAKSSAVIPSVALLVLLSLWLGISLPLTLFGSFLGFRQSVSYLTTGAAS